MSPVTWVKHTSKAAYSIVDSMLVGIATMLTKPVTLEYPDVRAELPPRTRMRLHNKIDDCIGCSKCAVACPVDCIKIETVKAEKTEDLGMTTSGNPKRLWLTTFDIDMAKCCYCNLCVYPCPTECLTMTPLYEDATYDRSDLVYHYSNLSDEKVSELKERQRLQAEEKKRKAEEKAKKAAEAAAAKPETSKEDAE